MVIRGQPKGGPPPEKTICFSNITAPRMARRPNPAQDNVETKDEVRHMCIILCPKIFMQHIFFKYLIYILILQGSNNVLSIVWKNSKILFMEVVPSSLSGFIALQKIKKSTGNLDC